MSSFNLINPDDFDKSAFKTIGKDWLLVTAGDEEKSNTMTASWGGFGIMWGKPVVYIVIRPQRYTKKFIDAKEHFSLSVLPEEYRKVLSYLGSASGRDEDKIAKSGLTLKFDNGVPYFDESDIYMVCRKMFAQPINPECFIDDTIDSKWYPEKDYHTLYIAEIEKLMVK